MRVARGLGCVGACPAPRPAGSVRCGKHRGGSQGASAAAATGNAQPAWGGVFCVVRRGISESWVHRVHRPPGPALLAMPARVPRSPAAGSARARSPGDRDLMPASRRGPLPRACRPVGPGKSWGQLPGRWRSRSLDAVLSALPFAFSG